MRVLPDILFLILHVICIPIEIAFLVTDARGDYIEGFIVGGEPVSLDKFPFQVQIFNFGAMCSGTIISSWTVLTAAHCFDINRNIYDIRVMAESRYAYDFKAKKYPVSKLVIHEDYNSTAQFVNDIALIFVKKSIRFGNYSQKALLVDNDDWMSEDETNFSVSGWGWTSYGGPVSEMGLLMTKLRFVESTECSRLHNLKISNDMFCLYGDGTHDTCKGDSGGGVLWNGLLVGITSHGDGCAKLNKPSVYANVFYFRKWIEQQIDRFFDIKCREEKNNV